MDVRGHRDTAWSVTCNLKAVRRDTVDACIDVARSLGWGVEGQLEVGAEGTPHYQLMVKTPQVRFSAVKKVFPTAHIEPARNRKALEKYVDKDQGCLEKLKKIEVTFLTYPMVRNKFFEWILEQDILALTTDHEERLRLWDQFIGLSISEGMEVDLIGMNPQNRACIAKYWDSYVSREVRRQTDRQDNRLAEEHTHASPTHSNQGTSSDVPRRSSWTPSVDVSSSTSSQSVNVPVQPGPDVHGNVHRKPDSV